jgi:hypothetical protein
MNPDYFVARLAENPSVFGGLFSGVSEEQARWKPAPEKWSLLEVVNHLYDEERDDFRTRLRLLLERPGERWPPIDPPRWASERGYNARDLGESLDNFRRERETSLVWLRGLSAPDWQARYEHPQGTISAGDLLASWLAHDFLHVRQMARLHWEYASHLAAPYATRYAGDW